MANNQIIDKALAYLAELCVIKFYQYSYTISGNNILDITASNLNASAPTGYTPVCISSIHTGNNNVVSVVENVFNSSQYVRLKNFSTGSVSATLYVRILYIKNGLVK